MFGAGSSREPKQPTVRVSSGGLGVAHLSIEQAWEMREALDEIIHTAGSEVG